MACYPQIMLFLLLSGAALGVDVEGNKDGRFLMPGVGQGIMGAYPGAYRSDLGMPIVGMPMGGMPMAGIGMGGLPMGGLPMGGMGFQPYAAVPNNREIPIYSYGTRNLG